MLARFTVFISLNNISPILKIVSVPTQHVRACQCYAYRWCITAGFNQKNQTCILHYALLEQGNWKLIPDNCSSVLTFKNRTTDLIPTENVLINSDAESGPCATDDSVVSPHGWNNNSSIIQIHFNISNPDGITPASPGPRDRGRCYFYGQITAPTTMLNVAAWVGSYKTQGDNARISLTFFDRANQTITGVDDGYDNGCINNIVLAFHL
ncbi:unnamed protein product [Adineta ricciae]|uniref:Uncharacterized protein n=1 Tax=Adineta ricciae TaxID=249248 RepID=A0A816H1A1_ADIRI|nr:unnamed protein product [Adineta ricciae]